MRLCVYAFMRLWVYAFMRSSYEWGFKLFFVTQCTEWTDLCQMSWIGEYY
jgi:hypothetical protein